MEFVFDVRKATAAAAYLCEKAGGRIDMLPLLKMLYLADKYALQEWHRPITSDRLVAMRNGPLLSRVYSLIRGRIIGRDRIHWETHFMPLAGHEVRLCPGIAVNLDPLSQRETEALDKAFEELRGLTVGQIIEKLHRECPEWSCPGESSQTIDPKAILSQVMKDSEAEEVWSELAKSQNARLTFSVR